MSVVKGKRFLAGRQAVLVFACAGCGKVETVEGYDAVHDATGSQMAAEERKLFCEDCEA